MDLKYSSQLSKPVLTLVDQIEQYTGKEILVKINPNPLSPNDPNPTAPAASVSGDGAVIYLRNLDEISEQGFLHELLHIKRYLMDRIPQIVPADGSKENYKITGFIDNALEHLVIVHQEVNYGFEPYEYWNATAKANWEKYPFPDMLDSWARKKNLLFSWLSASNLVTDIQVKEMAKEALIKEGLFAMAEKFNNDICSALDSKEECLSIVINTLGIPQDDVLLRYFDVKNGEQHDIDF